MESNDKSYHDYSRDTNDIKYDGGSIKDSMDKKIENIEKDDDDDDEFEFRPGLQMIDSQIKIDNNQSPDISYNNGDKEKIHEKMKKSLIQSESDYNSQDDKKIKDINLHDSHLSQQEAYQHLDYSKDSKLKESDEKISEFDLESHANPPKRENNIHKNIIDIKSSERILFKGKANKINHLPDRDINSCHSCSCLTKLTNCLIACGKFDSEYCFKKLYIDDLKKHHILYYTFLNCENKDQFFLKLSFFAFYVHLYFGLNTILTFNLSMAESYFDTTMAKPGYIAMNLLLPFVICGLIGFGIKLAIMPQYYFTRAENKFRNNENLKNLKNNKNNIIIEVQKKEEIIEPKKGSKRSIKNIKKNKQNEEGKKLAISLNAGNSQYEIQKKLFLESIYNLYKKLIIIYFAACFFVMAFNWYMMTSFCSIYRNTGVKLISNSFMSLFASLIIPFILGLIPSFIGYLGYKIGSKLIIKIYESINFII